MCPEYPKVVMRIPGPGTATGDDILIDSNGRCYRMVNETQARMNQQSTGGMVYTLHPDGTIR